MALCDWCNKKVNTLETFTDAFGENCEICNKCKTAAESGKCIKCGESVSGSITMKGLCTKCLQVEVYKSAKKAQQASMSLGDDLPSVELTDKEYEDWLLMSKTFNFSDLQKSYELRYLWITVKLHSVGIYDDNVIKENFKDIETLLDRRLNSLRGTHCRLLIAYTPEIRKQIKNKGIEIIDIENNTYLLRMESLA